MPAFIVLVHTDSDVLRASVCAALDRGGYEPVAVRSADEIRPALAGREPAAVVLDLMSPADTPEATVEALRAEVGDELPVLGVTSVFSAEPGRAGWPTRISAFLPRPVDPDELLSAIGDYLDPTEEAAPPRRTRVLLADDDPIGLKLSARLLELRGYEVHTARNGREALAAARTLVPDAIISDILMPELDGIHLCAEVRSIPTLRTVPVLLVSANFVESADRRLANEAGATAFVVKSPTLTDLFAALERALSTAPGPVPVPRPEVIEARWNARLRRQIEVQAARSMELAQRTSLRDAELTVLTRIADALGERRDVRATLSEVLGLVVERGELSFALLYLGDGGGDFQLTVMAPPFAGGSREVPPDGPMQALLQHAVAHPLPAVVPGERSGTLAGDERAVLAATAVSSMLLTPLRLGGRTLGVLVLAAEQREVTSHTWSGYARTVATHIAQALVLYRKMGSTPDGEPGRGERVERAERIAGDLRGLARLVAELAPMGTTDHPAVRALAELTGARVGPVDLRGCLRAALGDDVALPTGPLGVEGNEAALTLALREVGAAVVGTGRLVRVSALESEGEWTVQILGEGGQPGPSLSRALGGEIFRRHGGELVEKPGGAGPRAVVVRLPRVAIGALS